MRWGGLNNGALLAVASNAFDALIAVDKNLSNQQLLRTAGARSNACTATA